MSLAAKQATMIADLAIVDDAQERLALVVDRARARPALPAEEKSDVNRVRGCISHAWVVGELRDGRCHFRGDADSPLVRGLVVLLCDLYSDVPPAEVAAVEPELVERLGLARNLSPTRVNGLRSVRARIRDLASAALA